MFASAVSTGATEKLPEWEKSHAKTIAWSYDMEGQVKKVCGKILRTGKKRKLSNCTKFQGPASMIISSRKKNLNQWENGQTYAKKKKF